MGEKSKSLSFNMKLDTRNGILSRIGSQLSAKSAPSTPTPMSINAHNDGPFEQLGAAEEKLYQNLRDVRRALDYFLNSDIAEAETILKPPYKDSMYHALGHSFMLFLKSTMTFQEADITTTLEALKHTIELAGHQRKKDNSWLNSMTNWIKGTHLNDIKSMTLLERHAELVYAEAYLLKALLSIIHDESVMSFLREGLNIRSSYNTYMMLEKYVSYAHENDVQLDPHFTSGMSLGVGCFGLILSMLPISVLKVAEFIGFTSDRAHGLHTLESASDNTIKGDSAGLRGPLCDMVLISYHIVISKMIPLSNVNEELAQVILENSLKKYPKGVFFLYLNGRFMASRHLLEMAEKQYLLAIDTQKDWRQLQHMCFWELGQIYMIHQQWQKAYDVYSLLQKESTWSKSTYLYLKAVSLYMNTKENLQPMDEVIELMDRAAKDKQRIAGKSIPMEKFVARKARKFRLQNNRLFLPDLEILNAFSVLGFAPLNILELKLSQIDSELDQLEKGSKYYCDDLCLAHLLKATIARMLYEQTDDAQVMKSMKSINQESIDIISEKANGILLDHYVYYFSRYEKAQMLILQNDYMAAEIEVQGILKAQDKGQYNIGSGPHAKNKYSLANALAFKCHNCLTKIKSEAKQKEVV
ncbi:Tetratricopeptide repeat protein 39B [Choanephora cucurbitarum]|uniref:Tetratricopeptide repeat protein 39B n=1 Tax=Choanephora cucurbitarum TaxID=101091 RepID=A0A1C7N0R4_9FUNG|nr:Tetratricopeptide repeat protein 39B [Choanephora cucurbitarum]